MAFYAEKGRIQAWYPKDLESYNDGPISYCKCVVWDPKTDEVVYNSVAEYTNEYTVLLNKAKEYYNVRQPRKDS